MKFCSHCGKEVMDDAVICMNCGCQVGDTMSSQTNGSNVGLVVLSVLIPIVGIILAIVNWKKAPKLAKSCLTAALITWGVEFFITILWTTMFA